MTEVLINLRWLTEKGKDEDFKSFRDYGLAKEAQFIDRVQQAKNNIEEEGGIFPECLNKLIKFSKENIESQQYMNLTNVNLSDWKPQNTNLRKRAEQIDEKFLELYESNFEVQSSLIHGHWNSLSRFFLKRCMNPLHKLHFIPNFKAGLPTIETVRIVISLMVRTFNFWAKYMKNGYQTQIEKEFFGKNITPTNIGGSKDISR